MIKCLEPKKRVYTLVLEDRLPVFTLLSTRQTTGVQIVAWCADSCIKILHKKQDIWGCASSISMT